MGNQLDAVFICIALCNSEIAGKSTNSFSYKKNVYLFIHSCKLSYSTVFVHLLCIVGNFGLLCGKYTSFLLYTEQLCV